MTEQSFMPPKEADVQKIISQYGGDSNVMQAMTLLRMGSVENYLASQNGRVRDNASNIARCKERQDRIIEDIKRQNEIFTNWPGTAAYDDSGMAAKSALKVLTINLSRAQLSVAILLGISAIIVEILRLCGVL